MNKHTTTFVVNSKTADCMGRIFPKILNQIVSDAASEHTIELGVDRLTLNKEGLTWMLHSVHFSIEQTPHVDDVLQVTTYPSGLDRLFALRCYEINNSDGKPMIKISSRWMQICSSPRTSYASHCATQRRTISVARHATRVAQCQKYAYQPHRSAPILRHI